MFLFKQHISTEDIPIIHAYNHVCASLGISKKIIFTDVCEVFMKDNAIFHTSYISEVYKLSYIMVTSLYDLEILKTIRHSNKLILIYNEKPNDEDILYIDNSEDINNIAYKLEEILK